MAADYRLDGKEALICCSYNGEVKGYLPLERDNATLFDSQLEEQALQELSKHKDELLFELKNLEDNIRQLKSGEGNVELINPRTRVFCRLEPNAMRKSVDIIFRTENSVIKAAILTAEQLFEAESSVFYAQTPSNEFRVSLAPQKDLYLDIKIQTLIGNNMR